MMDEILEAYRAELEKVTWSKPVFTIISNLTAKPLTEEEAMSPDYWVRHLRETVRFREGVAFILHKGDGLFVEVGPGGTLTGFCRQEERFTTGCRIVEMFRHPREDVNDNFKFTTATGQLWSAGAPIDWTAYYEGELRSKVSLPTYSFDTFRLDFSVDPFRSLSSGGFQGNTARPFEEWFYMPNWKKSFIPPVAPENDLPQHFLVFSDRSPLVEGLIGHLKEMEHTVTVVYKAAAFSTADGGVYELNPAVEADFKRLFGRIAVPAQVIYGWTAAGAGQQEVLDAFLALKYTSTAFVEAAQGTVKRLTLLGDLGYPVIGGESLNTGMVTAMKVADVCAMEHPNLLSTAIDTAQQAVDTAILHMLGAELLHPVSAPTIAYRNGDRWVGFYEPVTLPQQTQVPLQPGDVCLITGGLGEVGRVLAGHLARQYQVKLVITGRSELPAETEWEAILGDDKQPAVASRIRSMQQLRALQPETFYIRADVSDYETFNATVNAIEAQHGRIAGVIHAAGNIDGQTFKPVESITASIAEAQFLPKIKGTLNLYECFKHKAPGFVWITSSLAAVLGGLTYGAYAVANRFIDAFVTAKRKELPGWYAINLDGISAGGIDHDKLVAVFERSFAIGAQPQLIVSVKDPNKVIEAQNNKAAAPEPVLAEAVLVDRPALSTAYTPPATPAETEVCRLWQSFFGYERIGIDDNFFELGGDSLKAMTILKRIHSQLQVEIGIEDFFSAPTIRSLAGEIDIATRLVSVQQQEQKSNMIKI